MAWASKQKCGGTVGKAVLLFLANYADENNQCWPSADRLADDCETSKRSIFTWLKKLEQMGLISHETRTKRGMRTSSLYTLNVGNPVVKELHHVVKQLHPEGNQGVQELHGGGEGAAQEPITEPITISLREEKKNVRPKAMAIQKDWRPNPELHEWATELRPELNIDVVVETFIDYWLGKGEPRKNWSATFRNWVRREKLSASNGNAIGTGTSGLVSADDRRSRLANAASQYMATKQGQAD